MKKTFAIMLIAVLCFTAVPSIALAGNTATHGEVSGKSVVAGVCSLLVWPGIGQYINENEKDKNITHAILGLTGIFRFWSCWDAVIDRQGGRWDGKI